MQITRKTLSISLKILIACLAGIGLWSELNTWGQHAWRLFDTYIMLAIVVYYLASAGFLLFDRRRSASAVIMPGFAALLMLNCLLIMLSALVFGLSDTTFPIADGFSSIIICGIVPILVLTDWLFCCQKGPLRPIDPFYWLAPALIYVCLVVATASLTPNLTILRFPYEIMNYPEIGVDMMLCWGFVIFVLMLLAGYLMYCLDFALSGKLAKHVVMPKLKPVVVDLPEKNLAPTKAAPAVTLASSAAMITMKTADKVPAPKPLVHDSTEKKTKPKPSVKTPPSLPKKPASLEAKADAKSDTKTGAGASSAKDSIKTNTKADARVDKKAVLKTDPKTPKAVKFHKPASIQNAPSNKKSNLEAQKTSTSKDAKKPVTITKPSRSSEFHVPKTVSSEPTKHDEAKDYKKSKSENSQNKIAQTKTQVKKDEFTLPKFSSRQHADALRPSKSLKPVESVAISSEKSPQPRKVTPSVSKPVEKTAKVSQEKPAPETSKEAEKKAINNNNKIATTKDGVLADKPKPKITKF